MEGYIVRLTPSKIYYDGKTDENGYAYFVRTSKAITESWGSRIETAKIFLKEKDAIARAKMENNFYSSKVEVLKVEVNVNILKNTQL